MFIFTFTEAKQQIFDTATGLSYAAVKNSPYWNENFTLTVCPATLLPDSHDTYSVVYHEDEARSFWRQLAEALDIRDAEYMYKFIEKIT